MTELDLNSIKLQAEKFWNWWSNELKAAMPSGLKQLFARNVRKLTIIQNGTTVEIDTFDAGKASDQRLEIDELTDDKVLNLIGADTRSGDSLEDAVATLVLAGPEVLRRDVMLPMAAEPNLAGVLKFELDRLTPFAADEIYYSYEVTGHHPEAEKIGIDLYFVNRRYVDETLQRFTSIGLQIYGIYPDHARFGDTAPESTNLLTQEKRPSQKSLLDNRVGVAALAVFVMLILVTLSPGWIMTAVETSTRSKIEELRGEAEALAAKRSTLINRLEAQEILASQKGMTPAKLDVIDELTRLLPDTTWVSKLDIIGSSVTVQGESVRASDLIEILDRSPYFENISFMSPVTINRSNNMQRYAIQMEATRP